MIKVKNTKKSNSIYYNDLILFKESILNSCIILKQGREDIKSYTGNFIVNDTTLKSVELNFERSINLENKIELIFSKGPINFSLIAEEKDKLLFISFPHDLPKPYNRLIIRISASKKEAIFGCGEQFSYFNLRGHNFPLFTGEQGVGRNKNTRITQLADEESHSGGDYYSTFYPQSSYVSTKNYFLYADTYSYSEFNFSDEYYNELLFWEIPKSIVIGTDSSIIKTVSKLSNYLGLQKTLPSWIYDGLILGVQGGSDQMKHVREMAQKNNLPLNGIWIQDWEGVNYTSFGKRLLWNWEWDKELYPTLDSDIKELEKNGIMVLGYINPYVAKNKKLCKEAVSKKYVATTPKGEPYYVDFGEFDCAIIDLTNRKAFEWYKSVIKTNMIDLGLKGWMADFGEYLPLDCILSNGKASSAHNLWPGLWAKLNSEVCKDFPDIVYFMRAGNAMSPKYCSLAWAGDQNVDWSEDDGIASVIPAALSLTMSAMGLHHSDIGGYTTLFDMSRSKELLIRWTEMSAFSSVMRSHEGNRPEKNHQIFSDDDTMKSVGYLVRVHVALKEYLIHCDRENSEMGIGVIRPLFFYYDNLSYYNVKDEYLLGSDLLVAPIIKEGAITNDVIIPCGKWTHLFSGKTYTEGTYTIESPLLCPSVFYKSDSQYKELFERIKDIEK